MAFYKDHNITIDIKRTPRIALQNIVYGETGNRFILSLTNDDIPVEIDNNFHIILHISSANGDKRQDDAVIADGKATFLLDKEKYAPGLNRCTLEIYTTENEADDTFICSAEFLFTAR